MMLIYSKADCFFVGIFLLQLVSSAAQKNGKITKDIMEAVESYKFEKSVGVPVGETEVLIRGMNPIPVSKDSKFCTQLAILETGKGGHLQMMFVQNGSVRVDVATKNIVSLKDSLEGIGATKISCHEDKDGGMGCTARVPQGKLTDLKNLDAVRSACVAAYMVNSGSVVTEGDIAMYADLARAEFGTDGSDVNVCVISDSFNCTCLADLDIESGDLPPMENMTIVQDLEPYQYCDYMCSEDPEICDYCYYYYCYDDNWNYCDGGPENCYYCWSRCYDENWWECYGGPENCYYCDTPDCFYVEPVCQPPFCGIHLDEDYWSYQTCHDEGRAMMQVIHDVAPGANLVFAAPDGKYDMASIIDGFVQEDLCDIIVDDIIFVHEPFFQDGIIAKAAERAVNRNVTYFTAAGNAGRNSWEGPFIDSGHFLTFYGNYVGNLHQVGMDDNGQPIVFQKLVLPNINYDFVFILQWDELFASESNGDVGSRSDLNIFLLRSDLSGYPLSYGWSNNIGQDPVETFSFNPSWLWWDYYYYYDSPVVVHPPVIEVNLAITLQLGPPPSFMKVIVSGPPIKFDTYEGSATTEEKSQPVSSGVYEGSSTIYGHANSAKACAVGAADYLHTPAFGVNPPEIEDFSSVGGTPIIFRKNNTRLSKPIIRKQPCFTGPDGGQITTNFFIPANDWWYDPPSSPMTPNLFYGTSASAAHAAGVAALILGSDRDLCESDADLPDDVYNKMKQSATDMFPLGGTQEDKFDYNTGYGFINALAALSPEPTTSPTPEPTTPAPTTLSPTPSPTPAPTTPSPTPEATTPEPTPAPTTPSPTPEATTAVPTPEATTPEPEPTAEPTTEEPEPTLSPTQSPTSPVDPTGSGNFFDYILGLIRSFIQAIIDAILSLFSL